MILYLLVIRSVHKHLSGRDFTEEELKNFWSKTETIKEELKEEVKEEKEITFKEAKDIYKEKFWRNPSSKMKLETILDKIK